MFKSVRFYIVLLCGIMAIGANYYLAKRLNSSAPFVKDSATSNISSNFTPTLSNPEATPANLSAPPQNQTPKPPPTSESSKVDAVNTQKPKEAFRQTPSPQPKKPEKIIMPVSGEIIVPYSVDGLVYSKTLGDWRSHKGIDIKSPLTTPVKCAYDGVIEKVYTDDGLGITIVIDHQNSMKTVYSNLSTDVLVKVGQKVLQGDIISGVGDSAPFETGEVGHLHFEVLIDGQNANPTDWLIY